MVNKWLRIRVLAFLLPVLTMVVSGQVLSKKDIGLYTKKIDKLMKQSKLTEFFYPEKTCGGALFGYFFENKLVFMKAIDGGDQLEFHSFFYIKDGEILKQIDKEYSISQSRKRIFSGKQTIFWKTDSKNPSNFDCSQNMIKDLQQQKANNKQ